ncbi:SHOCT domain-containing protein [Mesorhizobium sp.]|uniref:SHOCT domain-containing protein n=1 Tax=Mesorhizobium sp. TaxID=1871066 RepID=UPI0025CD89EE|nr:SHOCT domain-containing protein [Mesorhizobium sp.]
MNERKCRRLIWRKMPGRLAAYNEGDQRWGKPMRKNLMKSAATISAILAIAPVASWAQAQPDADRYTYGPGMMWWGGGWAMIFGPLFMILFFVVLVAAVLPLARWLGGPGAVPTHHSLPGRTPLDILKERFARGEIDKNEFEERRRVLGE